MEWVETTAKTVDAAKEQALEQLGVASDEAEFDVLEEPRSGLFGRVRGEARVRARVMPTPVRPKQERKRRGNRREGSDGGNRHPKTDSTPSTESSSAKRGGTRPESSATRSGSRGGESRPRGSRQQAADEASEQSSSRSRDGDRPARPARSEQARSEKKSKEHKVSNSDDQQSEVTPSEVGEAAEAFMAGLATAFGMTADTKVVVDDNEIDVRVEGEGLGLLVGHGGRTLLAVQDLARVASQRRLGDHATRLRVDVAGYRERRRVALEKFVTAVAQDVIDSGQSKALEPMQSADRKIAHDVLNEIEGVSSRSEGDDPTRRVVISPA